MSQAKGHWVVESNPEIEIEHRKNEPGSPTGWYLYAPGIFGRYCGETIRDAAHYAELAAQGQEVPLL